jgi:hypothetical protein
MVVRMEGRLDRCNYSGPSFRVIQLLQLRLLSSLPCHHYCRVLKRLGANAGAGGGAGVGGTAAVAATVETLFLASFSVPAVATLSVAALNSLPQVVC